MNEDDVVKGVKNYLEFKNSHRDDFVVKKVASAEKREKGVDLYGYCKSGKNKSNRYYIEAKGTLKASDNSKKKSSFNTEFRWAVSQIVLRMEEFNNAAIYGIAIPKEKKDGCLRLMRKSKGLAKLKVRLYLADKDENGKLFAEEMNPSDIYK